jgi:hypothetical protein
MKLKGTAALITGGNSGIGLESATLHGGRRLGQLNVELQSAGNPPRDIGKRGGCELQRNPALHVTAVILFRELDPFLSLRPLDGEIFHYGSLRIGMQNPRTALFAVHCFSVCTTRAHALTFLVDIRKYS